MCERGLLGLTSLKFLKFPVVDKFTGANCDCKSLDTQNVWGGGRGNRLYPYKLRYFA